MKLNWINVVATILIVAGIFLLVRRAHAPAADQAVRPIRSSTTNPITTEEVKNRFIERIESVMGRPLNDIEKQMLIVERHGDVAKVTVLDPLKTRLAVAEQQRAAEKAKRQLPSTNPADLRTPPDLMPVPASPAAGFSPITPLPTATSEPAN